MSSTTNLISPDLVDLALSSLDDEPDLRESIRRWLNGVGDAAHEARRQRAAKVVADALFQARKETEDELAGALAERDDAYRGIDDSQHSSVEAQIYLDACRKVESLERSLGLRE